MRAAEDRAKEFIVSAGSPGVQLDHGTALVEDPHDDLLAEEVGREETRRSIGLAFDPHLDAAVLGHAFLRDVHVGHDLDAGDDGGQRIPRAAEFLVEPAVDAVSDDHVFLGGFNMDVTGPEPDALGNDEVDEADDRRLLDLRQDVDFLFFLFLLISISKSLKTSSTEPLIP